MTVKQWRDEHGEKTDDEMYSVRASRRADVTVIGRHSVADAAHRNWAHSVQALARLNDLLEREFRLLAERQAAMLEAGTRAEATFDHQPLVGAAHLAWSSGRLSEAPIGPPVVG